jgi:hypothetical protein
MAKIGTDDPGCSFACSFRHCAQYFLHRSIDLTAERNIVYCFGLPISSALHRCPHAGHGNTSVPFGPSSMVITGCLHFWQTSPVRLNISGLVANIELFLEKASCEFHSDWD